MRNYCELRCLPSASKTKQEDFGQWIISKPWECPFCGSTHALAIQIVLPWQNGRCLIVTVYVSFPACPWIRKLMTKTVMAEWHSRALQKIGLHRCNFAHTWKQIVGLGEIYFQTWITDLWLHSLKTYPQHWIHEIVSQDDNIGWSNIIVIRGM